MQADSLIAQGEEKSLSVSSRNSGSIAASINGECVVRIVCCFSSLEKIGAIRSSTVGRRYRCHLGCMLAKLADPHRQRHFAE